MKHFTLFFSALLAVTPVVAQQPNLLTFDSIGLPLDTFWAGEDTNLYEEGSFDILAQYDTAFGGYWAGGVAISTMRDDSTGNYTNLYSSVTGGGHQSDAYGVVSASSEAMITIDEVMLHMAWDEVYLTNTTYAYYSMLNGDQFAKKFGGSTGDDPDYFFVRFYFYTTEEDTVPTSTFDFYLADYRYEDSSQDYIVDDWVYVDLNPSVAMSHYGAKVGMQLFSSDTGAFGMNTPAYFCMDDLRWDIEASVEEAPSIAVNIQVEYQSFEVLTPQGSSVNLYDLQGRRLVSSGMDDRHSLSTSGLSKGIYLVEVIHGQTRHTTKVLRW